MNFRTEKNTGAADGRLGLVAAMALVIGNMIGSGVFLLPATLAPFGWNAVAGWVVTTAGAVVLALVLARLTRALPEAGSPSGFVTVAFGPTAGFFISWIYLVSVWTTVATIAVAAVSYLSNMIPALSAHAFRPALAALALVWLLALVNLRGVKTAGGFQIVTVAIKIIPLVVVIAIAAVLFVTGKAQVLPVEAVPVKPTSINAAATLTLWALLGFESASIAAARVRNPEVNIARATLWGTALTGGLYLLVCSSIALLLPMDVAAASPAPFATFVARFWNPAAAAMVTVFAVISCIGALNGWTLLQAEMARDMAQRRLLPRWFSATDARGTPLRALLISTGIASLFVAMNASRSMQGLFEYLLLLSTSATLWLYLACALAAWRLRVGRVLAMIGAIYALWTLWGAGIGASGMSFILMALGLPIWLWMRFRERT
ncbi:MULTISPECIES: APC family permease [unclassified Novosphingobium]|uniref:APC family permease n=1 Tax=unclassified Novosphingobium TaxID=2644732 RepID=UPI0021046469|nr:MULTISPECIES: amino acid permease [unclassified Novosphingobium]